MHHIYSWSECAILICSLPKLQRDLVEAETGDQQQGAAIPKASAMVRAADAAKPAKDSKQRKTLRTYGQKKAKADPAAEHATPDLAADFLALLGGKK